jgi:hypothetical protein
MKALLLALALLIVGDSAQGQVVRLTADVAKDILSLAEKARAESNGDGGEAVREFGTDFLAKYRASFPCSQHPVNSLFFRDLVEPRGLDPVHCLYSPTAWYAEQLADALRRQADLSAVKPRDTLVVIFALKKLPVRAGSLTLRQAEAHDNFVDFEQSKVIVPSSEEVKMLAFTEPSGEVVERIARLFVFSPDALDMTESAEFQWAVDDRTGGSWTLTDRVMQSIR